MRRNRSSHGVTSFAGLALYLDLIKASGLGAAIRRHVRAAGGRGWLDIQMALAVILLNLAGGDCVEDIERLERDSGFSAILRAIEKDLLSRAERRSLKSRFRRERERATPSPSALSGWLERFHDPSSPKSSDSKVYEGLQSLRNMRRMEAKRRNMRAVRMRISQSFASLRQRLSQAIVRSTIQRLGSVTKAFA